MMIFSEIRRGIDRPHTDRVKGRGGVRCRRTANLLETLEDRTLLATVDLSLVKTIVPAQVYPGGQLTYTIFATNNGATDAAPGVTVKDSFTPPADATFGTLIPPAGWTYSVAAGGSSVTFTDNGTFTAGSTATFNIPLNVDSGVASGTNLVNTASITPAAGDTNSNPNNTSTVTTTVVSQADLSLFKYPSSAYVNPGGSLYYTIGVTNNGPNDAINAVVSDPLPAGTTFDHAITPSGWTESDPGFGYPGTVTFTDPDFASDKTATTYFTIFVNVDSTALPGTNLVNTATISSNTFDPQTYNNVATATTQVVSQAADLSIYSKTVSSAHVNPGGSLTYTIKAYNFGPNDAMNTVVYDPLPAGTTLAAPVVPPAGWTVATAPNLVTFTDTDFASGAAATFTFTVNVAASAVPGTSLVNTATIFSNTFDPYPANNSATATTSVGTADLKIDKTVSQSQVIPGGSLTYTINVSNLGPNDAINAVVNDPLPAGTTLAAPVVPPAGWTESDPGVGNSGTVKFTDPDFASGAMATFTITVSVNATALPGTGLVNTATISSNTFDPNTTNNSATATTLVVSLANLSIGKMVSQSQVNPGGSLTYTINVSNLGPNDAINTVVSDRLPAGTTFVGAVTPTGWTETVVGNTVTFTDPLLASAAATATFTITVNVDASAVSGTSLDNTATISSDTIDPDPTNNSATATTLVVSQADLSIGKTVSQSQINPGGSLTYTINVSNFGPDNAIKTVVSDSLPAGTTFAGATWPAGWTESDPGVGNPGTVTFTDPLLASLATATFTITVNVDASAVPGTILLNTATISSNTIDPVPTNNSAAAAAVVVSSFVVTNTNDSGLGSLQFAIQAANADLNHDDIITFQIPTSDPHYNPAIGSWTIPVQAGLAISKPPFGGTQHSVFIAGLSQQSQPGASITHPVIEITPAAGFVGDGLTLNSGGNTVQGLVIDGFQGAGLVLSSGTDNNLVVGNFVGTDPTGTVGRGNTHDGILLNDASSNSIIGNVVSDNGINQDAAGINLEASALNNIIAGNKIGTDVSGNKPLGNSLHGIFVGNGCSNNTIGGPTDNDRNVISGNGTFPVTSQTSSSILSSRGGVGVYIFGANTSGNVVQRNYIGTNVDGSAALPNSVIGVLIYLSSRNTVRDNLISGNGFVGLEIAGGTGGTASGNLVQGNLIGTNAGGTRAIPNGLDGITINNAPSNTIGGTAAGAGNLISANGSVAIQLFGTLSQGNVIEGNALGLDSTGRPTLPNLAGGIFVNTGPLTNQVGGTAPGQANQGQTRQQFTVTGFHQSRAASKTRHSPLVGRRFHIRGSRTAVLKHGTH